MYALNYVKAKSVKEAAAFLARNPEAKLLAGGMTLLPTLKQRLAKPTHLVDIAQLTELRGIAVKGGKLVIGAGVKHHEVATSAVVKKAIPALANAVMDALWPLGIKHIDMPLTATKLWHAIHSAKKS